MQKSIITDQISMDLEEALQIAKKNGFSYVDLHGVWGKSIEDCSDEEVSNIQELLKKYEMKVSNLATTLFFMCKLKEDYILKSFSPTFAVTSAISLEDHLRYLEKACLIAEKINCPTLRIFPFRFPENHILVGTEEDLSLIADHFKKAMVIAEKHKIIITVENCPYSHCPKPEMTLKLIQKVNHPQLKLLYDPANSYRAVVDRVPSEYLKLNIKDEIDLIQNKIGHIHLKNYVFDPKFEKPFIHTALCDGDLDYRQILSQLKNGGYKNTLSLEPEVPISEVIVSIDSLNQLLAEI